MKFLLKEIDPTKFETTKSQLNSGTILNMKYKSDSLEFQSPKMTIHELVKENDHEYIVLELLNTEACKTFYLKIMEIEKYFNTQFEIKLKSVFNENHVIVKIPFRNRNPLVKVYKDDQLFNYYHLTVGMKIITLLGIDKIWINNFNEPNYHLIIKEIMIT